MKIYKSNSLTNKNVCLASVVFQETQGIEFSSIQSTGTRYQQLRILSKTIENSPFQAGFWRKNILKFKINIMNTYK